MSKKKIYWLTGSLIFILFIVILLQKTGALGGESGIKVAIEKASKHNILETVAASGKIYPVTEVKISPDVSGEIIDLFIEEGDSVRKGQVLATINATIYRSMVNRAQAQLNQTRSSVSNASALTQQAEAQREQARQAFERSRQLFQDHVISQAEYEAAESAYKTSQAAYKAALETIKGNEYGVQGARASVSEAEQSLRKTTIYSPMSGIVSKLFIRIGERVVGTAQMAGTEILRVADMSRMKVDVEVGENDIPKVKTGDSADVEVEAYPNRKFKGIVVQISQSSTSTGMQNMSSLTDQVTNYTVSIEILVESYADLLNGNGKVRFPFRPGMSASVNIHTRLEKDILAVPINAVTTREKSEMSDSVSTSGDEIKEYVFLVNTSEKTELREVQTGIQDNEYIQILKGLSGGEKVVIAPFSAIARTLKANQQVKIVERKSLFEKKKENNSEED